MNNGLNNVVKIAEGIRETLTEFFNRDEVKTVLINIATGLNQLQDFTRRFYNYSQYQKKMYIEMSQFGWFPSYLTFKTPVNDGETPDLYMERCLTDNYDDVKDLILESYPLRKHIFEEAFKLYDEERYISAIPLFLTQLDGLSTESGLSPFFTDIRPNLTKSELKQLSDDEKLKFEKFPKFLKNSLDKKLLGSSQDLISYYEEVINNACESFIIINTNKLDMENPINKLNRHGILHGNVDFLHYADKKNCLKIISLILFVNHILGLIEKNEDESKHVQLEK